jgi:hypothetical protein
MIGLVLSLYPLSSCFFFDNKSAYELDLNGKLRMFSSSGIAT